MHSLPFLSLVSVFISLSCVRGQADPWRKHNGTMFILDPGFGACGFTNTSSQVVASVSQQVFTSFPGATKNPNKNPICRHNITITHDGKSATARIVDFFTDPGQQYNVGVSLPVFTVFAPESDGIVENVSWNIVR